MFTFSYRELIAQKEAVEANKEVGRTDRVMAVGSVTNYDKVTRMLVSLSKTKHRLCFFNGIFIAFLYHSLCRTLWL